MEFARATRLFAGAALLSLLAACAGAPDAGKSGLPTSGVYKIGKPYQVNGVWYYPKEDWSYDETGIASWYGPGFHEKRTANGEIYDQNDMTAAHKTLPMPSIVRVTNLDNGRSVVVRVNDRGPFVAGRVVDMTRRGAQLLGFLGNGTAKVRVQIMPDETRAVVAEARRNTPTELSEDGGAPPPKAAPRSKIEVAGIASDGRRTATAAGPAENRVVAPTTRPVAMPKTIQGEERDGRFMPSAVVTEGPVRGGRQIYVQAGAFTVPDNANRLSAKLSSVGATVSPVSVAGKRFYRVRVGPIADVDKADGVLSRVIESGATEAKIVVD